MIDYIPAELLLPPSSFLLPASLGPIPILELTPPSSLKKSPLSFHALMWSPFCNPFAFKFMHVMGGVLPSSMLRPSNVSACLQSIPFLFNSFWTLLHNGRSSTLLQSVRYAFFSSRRRVYPLPRFFSAHHRLPARHSFWLQRRERLCHEPRER